MAPPPGSLALQAAIAAHRFGLGEGSLAVVGRDPRGWLLAQLGPADAQRGTDLPDTATALARHRALRREQRMARRGEAPPPAMAGGVSAVLPQALREMVRTDVQARLRTAATSTRPFTERLALFWSHHFTVSVLKGSVLGLVGAFERDAIRPHVAGRFEALLGSAVRHPAMLRFLDNDRSAGPNSAIARRLRRVRGDDAPVSGLNENLARELLELHTLGVDGGYTQADVTALAGVLTGWRPEGFDPAWHEPGPKTVLGRRYPEGPEALSQVLADLCRHPSTARHVCTRLARHLVADRPEPALVAHAVEAWRRTDGDLAAVSRSFVEAPEAWTPAPAKFKTPEEFVLATTRLLGLGEDAFERVPDAGITALGQRVHHAPSPAGWPEDEAGWMGPEALWKRVEWSQRVATRLGARVDARALAGTALGPWLDDPTARELERAADGPQALALLLLAPAFQRR